MRLLNLHLINIGPFDQCKIFLTPQEDEYNKFSDAASAKHLIITGENGTGKSIIIDAIRTIIYGKNHVLINRNVIKYSNNFKISANFGMNNNNNYKNIFSIHHDITNSLIFNDNFFGEHICNSITSFYPSNFVLDYWSSKLSIESVSIDSLVSFKAESYFLKPLSGKHENIDIVKNIAFFDYLRDSKIDSEAKAGKFLYETAEKIINSCITNGKFINVSRQTLTPVFIQYGNEIGIEKLSSGSLYIMQRMMSLLAKAYAAFLLNPGIDVDEITNTQGLLLIDEPETHLHPKWQKVLFKNILNIFPNIQIIAATHSPFIVSSLENAKVIVCKAGPDGCYIEDETENYTNKPIEEILRMPLFDTDSFSSEISTLLKERKRAIENDDETEKQVIEEQLAAINPVYFKYLNIDKL